MKTCTLCGKAKSLSEFYTNSGFADGHHNRCKECCRDQARERYAASSDKKKKQIREYESRNPEKVKEWRRARLLRAKTEVVERYGGECACPGCNIVEIGFLTIDHVDGRGDHPPSFNGYRLYREVLEEGCPDRYQVLCWNCNSGRGINKGICPHEKAVLV